MRVLVVGANGQLGARVCRDLVRAGHRVRGSVRDRARARGLPSALEVVEADVATGAGVGAAFDGMECAVVTANAVVPRAGDSPGAFDAGAARLVDVAVDHGVRRFVLPSVPESPVDARVPPVRARRDQERRLLASALEPAVVRLPPFTDVWLALVGSSVPTRREPHATLDRPSPFLRRFRAVTGSLVEHRGLLLAPGSPGARHAFLTVADAARALVAAVEADPAPGLVEVGGPEALSWREVASVYAEVLGRGVRVLSTPAPVYAGLGTLLRPFGEVPASTMAMNRYLASTETPWAPGGGLLDPAGLTTVEDFLAAKAAMTLQAVSDP